MNAEFQGIVGRDKKDFVNVQCKEIEGSTRKGKTTDIFKKIGNIKEICHASLSTIKDRNAKDLTDAEDKDKWQEYTEELHKKSLNDQDNCHNVVTYPESGILECEVKWAL